MSRFLGNAIGRTSGPVPEASSGDAILLYNCNGCFNGSAVIPPEKLGVYSRYELSGQTSYYANYCSQMSLQFGGACGGACSENNACYCSNTQCSCGWIGRAKCFSGSYPYNCAGNIAWIFGCSSGCLTACSAVGFVYRIAIDPVNVCDGSTRDFLYTSLTSNLGGDMCCIGIRNSGRAINCCGAHPACLKGVCFNNPGNSNPFSCMTGLQIYGYGKISV